MENENNQIELNASALGFLREITKWSKFISIVGFVGIGLMIIGAIFMATIMSTLPDTGNTPFALGAMNGFLSAIYLLLAALYFFPVYYLYKFSSETKKAIETRNSDLLSDGLAYLKSHYKFIGIMMVVVLSLYGLIFIVSIIAASFAAAM